MRIFFKSIIAASFAVVIGLQAHPAKAVVIVLGEGMGQNCYEAAFSLSKGLIYIPPLFTGSQIDLKPIEICNMALDQGGMNLRDTAGTYVNRGVLEFLEGDHKAALADFDSALRVDSDVAEAHANRGAALVALKRWADSIPSITKGIEMQAAEMEKSYYNRAIAFEEVGNTKAAYLDYMKAAELKPDWEAPKAQLTRFTVRRKTQ